MPHNAMRLSGEAQKLPSHGVRFEFSWKIAMHALCDEHSINSISRNSTRIRLPRSCIGKHSSDLNLNKSCERAKLKINDGEKECFIQSLDIVAPCEIQFKEIQRMRHDLSR